MPSGGDTRSDARKRLAANHNMIASFSRADRDKLPISYDVWRLSHGIGGPAHTGDRSFASLGPRSLPTAVGRSRSATHSGAPGRPRPLERDGRHNRACSISTSSPQSHGLTHAQAVAIGRITVLGPRHVPARALGCLVGVSVATRRFAGQILLATPAILTATLRPALERRPAV